MVVIILSLCVATVLLFAVRDHLSPAAVRVAGPLMLPCALVAIVGATVACLAGCLLAAAVDAAKQAGRRFSSAAI